MKSRYYSFFAMFRLALANKRMHFSAPANKTIEKVLVLLRERGLISGFTLDFSRPERKGYWHGFPKYKVFFKYNYWGNPLVKRFILYKATKTNFTKIKISKNNYFTRLKNNDYYLINGLSGIKIMTNSEINKLKQVQLLAKIKI